MSEQTCRVFRVEHKLGVQDPLMGPETRYHNKIFVETKGDGSGCAIEVERSISDKDGMKFAEMEAPIPEDAETYVRKHYLGKILVSDYPKLVELLAAIPPPSRQRNFNTNTMATEHCKPDGTFYGPDEPRPPYEKCTE
ncbi:hypothetical protein IQ06DRAFT_361798 [Phaeosphaeriaceae sp. SRC1lsM3a]|nr:hypothetical protein IQ06DRAFT_361798 [Stagonospora sp. SRC1lsM3a]